MTERAAGPIWVEEVEALVRGLAHALSNRVATLGLASEMVDDEDPVVRAESRAQLRVEVERLEVLNRLLKLLPREGVGRPEPLQPAEVLAEALELHRHHLELRDVALEASVEEGVLPVRVERSVLLRALVLFLSTVRRAARAAEERAREVQVRLEGSADEVWVAGAASTAAAEPELPALAAQMGGRLDQVGGELRLVLPSLLVVRRREAAAREAGAP